MADLGNKHECLNCGTKFYDLGRSELICPSCGADQEELAKEEAADEKPVPKKEASGGKKAKQEAKTDDEPEESQDESPSPE